MKTFIKQSAVSPYKQRSSPSSASTCAGRLSYVLTCLLRPVDSPPGNGTVRYGTVRGPGCPHVLEPHPSDVWLQERNLDWRQEAAECAVLGLPGSRAGSPHAQSAASSHVHSAQGFTARLGRCHNRHLGLLPRLLLEKQRRSEMPVR